MKRHFAAAIVATTLAWAGAAQAEDLEFPLTNRSEDTLVAFHVSHAGTDSWEENLIEGGILAPGYEIDVLIADGLTTCIYDIRSEFESGDVLEDFDLDLCEMGGYSFE